MADVGRLSISLLAQFLELDPVGHVEMQEAGQFGRDIGVAGSFGVPIDFLEQVKIRRLPCQFGLNGRKLFSVVDIPTDNPNRIA